MFSFLRGHSECSKRFRQLQEEHEELRRQFKMMQMDWESTYDKLRSIVQRIVKRAERAEALTNVPPEEAAEAVPEQRHGLTPQQQVAQQRILARRARLT